jgi:RND superfamily putative drug exporter
VTTERSKGDRFGREAPPGRGPPVVPAAENPKALRHPVRMLALALVCAALLGTAGLGIERDLQPTLLSIPGTASSNGEALAQRYFGDSTPFTILLHGPAAAIDRQGPPLLAALRRYRAATAISPWDRGAPAALRPGPRRALILLDFHRPLSEAIRDSVPALERTLAAHVHPPLEAIQSGFATISRALQKESLVASERAELLAAPLLVLILLLVFRSAVAAAIPLAFGAMTVFAGRGVLDLLGSFMRIDALSLIVCTMMGLALGVDYSLFIVSRFREELAAGRGPSEAALRTRRSAGRTTALAGSTLFLSILASAFVAPGTLLVSLATALVVVAAISVAIAWGVLPALLALLGERVNAGRIGGRGRGQGRPTVAAAAALALRRPARAAALIAIPLALLAAPALAFNTGAPGIDELSASSPARQSAEGIGAVAGPGWEAPFSLLAAAPTGPITTPHRLALLVRTQRRIASQPGVAAVIGPAPIGRAAARLHGLGRRLGSRSAGAPAQLARLGPGLSRASAAVARLRGGISRAAAGSGLLDEGSGRAGQGADLLAAGIGRAAVGGGRAGSALSRLAAGSARFLVGQRRATAAAHALSFELATLLPGLEVNGLARSRQLAAQLQSDAAADPSLRPQAEAAIVIARELGLAHEELGRLHALADALNGGLGRLAAGGQRLLGTSRRLASAAGGIRDGLDRLGTGAGRLASGLGELQGGAGALQQRLAAGFGRSYPLQVDLRRAGARVAAAAVPLRRGVRELRRASPGLFASGYFVLSALDGARPDRRALAGEAVDLGHGGQAARLLVVPDAGFNSAGSRQVGTRLEADAASLSREGGLLTGIAGGAATLNDYGAATQARLPLVIGTVILVTFLVLVAILRTPLLAALAVGLNLASVAAAIGVMTLICKIPAGYPLGGHPYIDTVGAAAIFGVTFGLSIDYAVFLIARMRESWERHGDNAAAIHFGLHKTAGVITGAAAIMVAVFVSFATAPVATVSQMGIGLTVAVLIDATVVRIVLLPALMLLLGERVWHVPAWLERALPRLNLHGEPEAAEGRA